MTDQEAQLKLQAFMDGELSVRETSEVRDLLERNPEARALLAELRNTKAALAGNEAECRLPESREFFWSKIEREIQRSSRPARPVVSQSWFAWFRRHLLPVSGIALVSCLLALAALRSGGSSAQMGEMELNADDMSSYTYRDQQQKITMVWLSDRNEDSQFTEKSGLASVTSE